MLRPISFATHFEMGSSNKKIKTITHIVFANEMGRRIFSFYIGQENLEDATP